MSILTPSVHDTSEYTIGEAAKAWMITNALARRNLSDGDKFEMVRERRERLLAEGKAKRNQSLKQGDEKPVLPIIGKTGHNTQLQMAEELGWGHNKVAMADKVWKEADAKTIEAIKAGDVRLPTLMA